MRSWKHRLLIGCEGQGCGQVLHLPLVVGRVEITLQPSSSSPLRPPTRSLLHAQLPGHGGTWFHHRLQRWTSIGTSLFVQTHFAVRFTLGDAHSLGSDKHKGVSIHALNLHPCSGCSFLRLIFKEKGDERGGKQIKMQLKERIPRRVSHSLGKARGDCSSED